MGCGDEQLNRTPVVAALPWIGLLPIALLSAGLLLPLGVLAVAIASQGGGSDPATALDLAIPIVLTSAGQAGLSALLTLLIALPLTYLVARREFRGRRLLAALMTLPFLMPTVVTGLAIRNLLGDLLPAGLGLVLVGHVLVNLAVVLRLVGPAWAELDGRLSVVAASLGAGAWQTFRTVTLPLLAPTVLRATAVVFTYCFSSLGLVLVLGGGQVRTLETQLLRQISLILDFRGAAVTALCQFLVVAGVLWLAGRSPIAAGAFSPARRQRLARPWLAWLAVGLLALPLFGLLVRSASGAEGWTLRWWALLLTGDTTAELGDPRLAVLRSVMLAIATAVITATAGLGVAVSGLPGRRWPWLQSAAMLPLTFSAATIGLGLLLTYGRPPLDLRGSWWLVPLAHSLMALPLVAAVLAPALRAVDGRLSVVAASLGAGPNRAFLTGYGPIGIRLAGQAAGLSAAVSLGEFGAASFLTATDQPTLPVQIMRLLSYPGAESLGVAAAASVLLAVAAAGLVWALDRSTVYQGKGGGL